jgi:hypothetical protein
MTPTDRAKIETAIREAFPGIASDAIHDMPGDGVNVDIGRDGFVIYSDPAGWQCRGINADFRRGFPGDGDIDRWWVDPHKMLRAVREHAERHVEVLERQVLAFRAALAGGPPAAGTPKLTARERHLLLWLAGGPRLMPRNATPATKKAIATLRQRGLAAKVGSDCGNIFCTTDAGRAALAGASEAKPA